MRWKLFPNREFNSYLSEPDRSSNRRRARSQCHSIYKGRKPEANAMLHVGEASFLHILPHCRVYTFHYSLSSSIPFDLIILFLPSTERSPFTFPFFPGSFPLPFIPSNSVSFFCSLSDLRRLSGTLRIRRFFVIRPMESTFHAEFLVGSGFRSSFDFQ